MLHAQAAYVSEVKYNHSQTADVYVLMEVAQLTVAAQGWRRIFYESALHRSC